MLTAEFSGGIAGRVLLAAVSAAGLSYACNRLSRSRAGGGAVVFVAPGLEESFKTGAALLVGAPVLLTHVVFGGLEALYDLGLGAGRAQPHAPTAATGAGPGPTGRHAGAAVAGLVGHALFGALTVAVAAAWGWWPLGVGVAYLAHVAWNALVMGRASRRVGSDGP
ncbi:MAG: hypothetical protein C4551_10675 [Bacillota bacterium]|nr:MAG: hypothetical protein C4551_10675 [Bacillota bacterium]